HPVCEGSMASHRFGPPVPHEAQENVPAVGIVEHDPPTHGGITLIPADRLNELAAEHGVLALNRVFVLERIANAQVAHENRKGDLAAVDTLLKSRLPLQETHGRGGRAIEGFA